MEHDPDARSVLIRSLTMLATEQLRTNGYTASVVKLHHLHDNRFSLALITDDETERIRKARTLSENSDIEVAIREETSVNAKKECAPFNKTLLRILCHNAVVAIHEMKESDIDPGFLANELDTVSGLIC